MPFLANRGLRMQTEGWIVEQGRHGAFTMSLISLQLSIHIKDRKQVNNYWCHYSAFSSLRHKLVDSPSVA